MIYFENIYGFFYNFFFLETNETYKQTFKPINKYAAMIFTLVWLVLASLVFRPPQGS